MLRERDYIFKNISILVDFFLAVGAFLLAHFLRNWILSPYIFPEYLLPSNLSHYYLLFILFPPLTIIILLLNGYYRPQRLVKFGNIIKIITISCIEIIIASAFIIYLVKKGDTISRGQMLLAPAVFWVLLSSKSAALRLILARLRQKGKSCLSVLVVGSSQRLENFISVLDSHPFWGFKIMGILTDDPSVKIGEQIQGHTVVASACDILDYLERHPVDEVIFVPNVMRPQELTPYLEGCELMGIRSRVALNFFEHTIARPSISQFQEIPLITYNPVKEMNFQLFIKYTLDRVLAFMLILLFSPIMLATALAIRLTSRKGEPIFYRQVRVGLNGKKFVLYKFRSMKVGADKELEKLRPASDVAGPIFKMKNDPRVTKVGRFIRKFSIDELPQLFNVLKGEMSLVGPRPPIPEEVEKYDRWQRRRLSMKPGITCLWQVMGRNKLSFDMWMRLDLEYIDNWSLALDFKIMLRTVFVVATGYGAM